MRIGLTGGIASGKSTVVKMLAARGAFITDADQAARSVTAPGTPTLREIAATFGQAVLRSDGSLDRKKLGSLVFTEDKTNLRKLEAIQHPAIRAHMRAAMDTYLQDNPRGIAIADIPLLYETSQDSTYDAVIVVYVPPALELARLMARDNLDEHTARMRIRLQMSLEEKRARGDYVIDNRGSLAETEMQVHKLYEHLTYVARNGR
jgi:dephospho-CoA kinase